MVVTSTPKSPLPTQNNSDFTDVVVDELVEEEIKPQRLCTKEIE